MCTGAEIQAGTAIVGAGISYFGSQRKRQAQHEMSVASQQAEALRREQMNLEFQRKTRELARDAAAKRANAISVATGQTGSSAGESSALAGAEGQIGQERGVKQGYLNTANRIGNEIFDANAAYARAQERAANASGLASIGSALLGNAGQIGNIGSTLFGSGGGSGPGPVGPTPLPGSIFDSGDTTSYQYGGFY